MCVAHWCSGRQTTRYVSSTTGHRGGTHGHQRWTRVAGDLDLSPPPPPTRAPRLVSLQSTTKPSQLPPSPRRRRPPCPDRRGVRTPTLLPDPLPLPYGLPTSAARRRRPSWGRVEIHQDAVGGLFFFSCG